MSNNKKKNNSGKQFKNNKRKGSWQDRESRDMRRDAFERDEKRVGHNDISWYVEDPQLLVDSASLPWSNQIGQPLSRNGISRNIRDAVPGAAMMLLLPVLGNVSSPTDPVNVAAQSIYSDVRHANSGAKNYDPTDLMIYIMTLDSIYYWVSFVKRAYATANMFSMENKYLPELLFAMQGIDGASIRANLPAFRTRLNTLLLKVSTLVIPNKMPIFERHAFLFSDYYTEGNSIKDQIYFFKPNVYYTFQYDNDGKGMLKSNAVPASMNANDLLNVLESMIDAIYMEEDFGLMAGDILKAYGEGNVHKISFLPDGVIARPVYNYTVLNQFKNAKCYLVPETQLDITQVVDPNAPVSPYIHQKPALTSWYLGTRYYPNVYAYTSPLEITGGMIGDQKFIDVFEAFMNEVVAPDIIVSSNPSVTPEETMVSTRLTMIPDVDVTTDANGNPVVTLKDMLYGTEIAQSVRYGGYHYTPNSDIPVIRIIDSVQHTLTQLSSGISDVSDVNYTYESPLGMQALMSSFKFHPATMFYNWHNLNNVTEAIDWHTLPLLDIDNYTTVDADVMRRLHNIAVLGEYRIPRITIQ